MYLYAPSLVRLAHALLVVYAAAAGCAPRPSEDGGRVLETRVDDAKVRMVTGGVAPSHLPLALPVGFTPVQVTTTERADAQRDTVVVATAVVPFADADAAITKAVAGIRFAGDKDGVPITRSERVEPGLRATGWSGRHGLQNVNISLQQDDGAPTLSLTMAFEGF